MDDKRERAGDDYAKMWRRPQEAPSEEETKPEVRRRQILLSWLLWLLPCAFVAWVVWLPIQIVLQNADVLLHGVSLLVNTLVVVVLGMVFSAIVVAVRRRRQRRR